MVLVEASAFARNWYVIQTVLFGPEPDDVGLLGLRFKCWSCQIQLRPHPKAKRPMIQIRVLHERAAAEVHDHGDAEDHQNRPSRGNASHTLSTYPQISKGRPTPYT